MKYEQKALYWGFATNTFSTVIGVLFFIYTNSKTILLDAAISAILCLSTLISIIVTKVSNKKNSEKYPLGRNSIENIFVIFRTILMLLMIIWSLINGIMTIVNFYNGTLVSEVTIELIPMLIYCFLMTLSCFAITFTYHHYNKKINNSSDILKIEIKAALYDGLVTLFATISLLLFTYIEAFNPIKDIGDSITTIILSIIYLYVPIKELISQIKILIDKRENQEIEQKIKKYLNKNYSSLNIVDIYCSYSSEVVSIYVSLFPKDDISSIELEELFDKVRNNLYEKYEYSKVILILSHDKIHNL